MIIGEFYLLVWIWNGTIRHEAFYAKIWMEYTEPALPRACLSYLERKKTNPEAVLLANGNRPTSCSETEIPAKKEFVEVPLE